MARLPIRQRELIDRQTGTVFYKVLDNHGLSLGLFLALPPDNAEEDEYRGVMLRIEGGDGEADSLWWNAKGADDEIEWREIISDFAAVQADFDDLYAWRADFEAEGDLLAGSAAGEYVRVPVGTNGKLLVANSAATGGLEWTSTIPVSTTVDAANAQITVDNTATSQTATVALSSNGTEKWLLQKIANDEFKIRNVAGGNDPFRIVNGNPTFVLLNPNGDNTDTRISGDTESNLIYVDASVDFVGIATSSPAAKLDVNADNIRVRTAKTPATAGATGIQGQIAWDADYVYVCVATNTWKRAALATW